MNEIVFPVALFTNQSRPYIYKSEEDLTTANAKALKNNFFNDSFIVDSSNYKFLITSVEKIHGIGLFGGYNIFLNQKVRIKLNLIRDLKELSLNNFLSEVIKRKKHYHGNISYEEIVSNISSCGSIKDLIMYLLTLQEKKFNT
ncbi:hypothetical protein [Hymenobacter glacieicola]|uniref:Uncharacterized protein n=1 Tax=Hymenobacter glacieicola TaxID=1562124 RepID=A0ABQ1X5E6_9BACT|nr:hypothetical protein [Hymenobacter glacieicola]GGG59620.1 hypothetical protein GCM10011378_39510 [Hymenobacter glacieicola]